MCIVEPTVTSSNASKEQVHRFTGRGTIRTTVIGSWPKPAWLFKGLPSHSGDGKGVSSGFTDCTEEAKDKGTPSVPRVNPPACLCPQILTATAAVNHAS